MTSSKSLTFVRLTFRTGVGFSATSVSTETVAVPIEFLRDDTDPDDQERKGLHRLPRMFVRLNTFMADASGGGVLTSFPRFPFKKTTCKETGMRFPPLVRLRAFGSCCWFSIVAVFKFAKHYTSNGTVVRSFHRNTKTTKCSCCDSFMPEPKDFQKRKGSTSLCVCIKTQMTKCLIDKNICIRGGEEPSAVRIEIASNTGEFDERKLTASF